MPDRSFPQPHEGISGTDRGHDDLLSLEEAAIPRRHLMAGMARCLRQAVLVGNQAPIVARMWERMQAPVSGDLVVEVSSFGRRACTEGMGILLAHRHEWWQTDEEWAAELEKEREAHEEFLRGPHSRPGDGPFDPARHERLTDHAWYVQYGPRPEDVCRWVNCQFLTVLSSPADYAAIAGTRTDGRVTLTRNDVRSALGDSGFTIRHPEEP